MFNKIIQLLNDNKLVIISVVGLVLFFTVYPSVFKAIYETGRDFGRSLVNLWVKE